MLLELRLETLWDRIDYFVICESVLTISGSPKPLFFDVNRFKKYESKIRHLIVRDYPFETTDAWKNERWQRDYLINGLYDAKHDDWIILSDVDEIPRPQALALYKPNIGKRADFQQYMYAYYLNNRWELEGAPAIWVGSKVTSFKNLMNFFGGSLEVLRGYKLKGPLRGIKRAFFKTFLIQKISDGGWHFTWMAGVEKIIQKLESFAHQEFNKPEFKARRWAWVDPLKDMQAEILAVEKGWKSKRASIAESGGDIEDTYKEQASDEALADQYGLEFSNDDKTANVASDKPKGSNGTGGALTEKED
jgi:beta-1,4-mannosyl-glycoprotein beta-1,4-N-acetylglucosaminyltransferase